METITRTVRVGPNQEPVTFTAHRVSSARFGVLWTASNDYGEPRLRESFSSTPEQAIAEEVREVEALLS